MNNTSIAGMKRTHLCGELRLSDAARLEMEQRLRAVIREQEDGIKIFPLCASCQAGKQGLGAVRFPDGDPGWILL